MKADSSTLLYIIISVVLLAISAFNKNKKKPVSPDEQKNGQPAESPHENTWEKELEDIFGKVLGEEPAETPRPEHETQPAVHPIPIKNEPELQKQSLPQSQNTVNTEKVPQPSISLAYHNEEQEGQHLEINEQELAKAVIYSEILNRKYF